MIASIEKRANKSEFLKFSFDIQKKVSMKIINEYIDSIDVEVYNQRIMLAIVVVKNITKLCFPL